MSISKGRLSSESTKEIIPKQNRQLHLGNNYFFHRNASDSSDVTEGHWDTRYHAENYEIPYNYSNTILHRTTEIPHTTRELSMLCNLYIWSYLTIITAEVFTSIHINRRPDDFCPCCLLILPSTSWHPPESVSLSSTWSFVLYELPVQRTTSSIQTPNCSMCSIPQLFLMAGETFCSSQKG